MYIQLCVCVYGSVCVRQAGMNSITLSHKNELWLKYQIHSFQNMKKHGTDETIDSTMSHAM